MKAICQLYLPGFYRSYGKQSLETITKLLGPLMGAGFAGVYLISLWEDGGFDNGFDVINYSVNPKFGTEGDLGKLIRRAHEFGMMVGVDVVPNHVSDKNVLAQRCLNDVSGYEDCLYVVSHDEAECLTEAGVPSFFGELAYSDFGDKYVRSSFVDHHQLNLNWESQTVQEYFVEIFRKIKARGVDFVRVDCGPLLLEDVSKASKENVLACIRFKESVEAVRKVAGGMLLFFEWFTPENADIFNEMPECYGLDCSYALTGQASTNWTHKKLIPLLGGHDQMTVADRGINVEKALKKMREFDYGFLDIQTLVGWKTDPNILPGDVDYDADLKNPNQRYRARRPIKPAVQKFLDL